MNSTYTALILGTSSAASSNPRESSKSAMCWATSFPSRRLTQSTKRNEAQLSSSSASEWFNSGGENR